MIRILTIVLFLIPTLGNSQSMFLKVSNDTGQIFCGMTISYLKADKKQVTLVTDYGALILKVEERKIDKYGSFRCVDKNGNVYILYAISDGEDGRGLVFKPVEPHLMTFVVSNQSLCDSEI